MIIFLRTFTFIKKIKTMKQYYLSLFLFSVSISTLFAQQSISATIIDSTSQKAIPYATITFNNTYGVISNETGKFVINLENKITKNDSLFISCLGYEAKHIAIEKFTDSIISLSQKKIELNEVIVSNKKYTANEIIDKVKENITANYNLEYIKSKLFYRESYFTKIIKSDINLKKSTIPEFNQQFVDSLILAIPKKSDNYTEILGSMYGKMGDKKPHKLDIIKASQLYDKNNEITFEAFEERINSIIKKRVKKDSYFKIRSGIFSTKEEMDSTFYDNSDAKEAKELVEDQKKREKEKKENFLKYRRNTIVNLEKNSFIFEDTDLNFLEKSKKYNFKLLDYAFLNNNFVYKITFSPKRSAKYKGTLYINPTDFAIERVDYENVKPLKSFSLLGLSFKQYLHRGTLIYSKNNTDKYVLKYAEMEHGQQFGIKRPFKIIEKNKHVKGRRKQNELSGKIHFIISNTTKKELVLFENFQISENTFTAFKENASVKPTYLPKYDPDFWKGHNVIEPNQAIKDFKSLK